MKTPREILLKQHRSEEPKLDTLRQQVLAQELFNRSAATAPSPFEVQSSKFKVRCFFSALFWLPRKLWTELVWPCRRIWTGLAAAWLLILVANLGMGGSTNIATSRVPARNAWSMAALKAQQQMLSQMLEPDAPAAEPAPRPGPRGEKRAKISVG